MGLIALLITLLTAANRPAHQPLTQIQQDYIENMASFAQACQELQQAAKALSSDKEALNAFRQTLSKTRHHYKKIQFLIEYLQPQDALDHLNGAPLPKTERNAPRLVVLEPKGLQTIEEGAYAEVLDQAHLRKLTKELNAQVGWIKQFAAVTPFTNRQALEAIRFELIRIMSLGITGFDSPASGEALSETLTAWQSISQALGYYLPILADDPLAGKIREKLEGAETYLAHHQDFDTFDRVHFIREYVEPLYRQIGLLHRRLGYETLREAVLTEVPINYESDQIFSSSFLNPYAYQALGRAERNDALLRLGKLLFFDPVLSHNLERSCASCHKPQLAFTDGLPTSLALRDNPQGRTFINRNAPTLLNAIYTSDFFYDLRADRLETQMEHVIFNPAEFGTTYQDIFSRLESSSDYRELFAQALPQYRGAINRHTLSLALMAYLQELNSFDSPVDRYLRGEDGAQLSQVEKDGMNLFMGKAACATCHFAPTFAGLIPPHFEDHESEVLGVLKAPGQPVLDDDLGRMVSKKISDETEIYKRSFKTTTVRNVAYTAPYFHNGAYATLAEVVDFYNHGGAQGLGLELPNQTLPPDSLHLSAYEKEALIAFMQALSDTAGTTGVPSHLPALPSDSAATKRVVGGLY